MSVTRSIENSNPSGPKHFSFFPHIEKERYLSVHNFISDIFQGHDPGNIRLREIEKRIPLMTNNWNVLVYMAADNNLKEEAIFILTEISKGDVPDSYPIRVLAQFDSGKEISVFDFTHPRTAFNEIAPKLSGPESASNKSDAELLKDFLNDQLKPESQNLVVLSGHGGGAIGNFLPADNQARGLSISALGEVLKSAYNVIDKKIDILGMDSCLMSMVEIGFELRQHVKLLIGAQGYARNTGWPYNQILSELRKVPNMSPEKLGCNIVQQYIRYYSVYTHAGVSVDHACCDLEQMDDIANAILDLAQRMKSRLELRNSKNVDEKAQFESFKRSLITAHWEAQSYKFEQYVDIWDFCDRLAFHCEKGDKIITDCNRIKRNIQKAVHLTSYSGAAFQHSHGLSIYFPWATGDLKRDLPEYRKSAFGSKTKKGEKDTQVGWADFLEEYGAATQRDMREDAPNKDGEAQEIFMPIEFEVGISVAANVRDNILRGTNANVFNGSASALMIPRVKNPAEWVLKYEDECATTCHDPSP
jgi:hypothetical protein